MSTLTPVQSSTVSVSHASSLVASKVSQLKTIFATPSLTAESRPSSADVMATYHFPSSEDSEGSSGILTPGTPISLSSNSYDAEEVDTKTRYPEETEADDLEQPTKKVKLSTPDSQNSLRHRQRRKPKVAPDHPKTPKKKKKKKKKRKALSNKQINPLSVKSTSKSSMQRLMRENADISRKAALPEPYLVNIEALTPLMLYKYTGNDANVPIFLQFLNEEVEICPLDVSKVLKSWGSPKQADFASRLARFAFESEAGDLNKAWGKVASTLFNIFASIAWPNKSKSIKPLWRCFYGVRFRFPRLPDGLSTPTTPSTPSTASWDSKSSTSLRSRTASWDSGTSTTHRVKHRSSLTSSRASQNSTPYRSHFSSHTASYPLKKAAMRNVFIPYYDVLQNEDTYVVRIFLPLVTPQEMKSIKIDSNLSRKTLNISGTYIPGSNIGQNLVGLFGIRRPLQPIFYQPANHYGPFDLQVALPSDIQDYQDSVKVGHECWGVAFQYARRKQIEHASIHLSSCFGSCHVDSDEKKTQDGTVDESSTSAVNTADDVSNNAVPERSDHQSVLAEAASSSIALARPTLLGRSVSVPGEMWGPMYNGTTYTGYVRRCTRNTVGANAGFDTYRVVFEDCTDEFSLSDLKSFGVITEDEFTLLFDKDTQF
jgi:hypothetical protein